MNFLGPQKQQVTQVGHRTTIETAPSNTYPESKHGTKRTRNRSCSASESRRAYTAPSGRVNKPVKNDSRLSASKHLRASEVEDISNELFRLENGTSIYSQRRAIASTPTSNSSPLLSLAHPAYGLPEKLTQNFLLLGIKSIYPWQSKCLLEGKLLKGEGNLVYTAPTGGGKSLIADVLMIKQLVDNPHKKAILVLPYVALVQEKLRWLRRAVDGVTRETNQEQHPTIWRRRGDESNVRIVGYFGGSKSRASWADMDIAVCTIEKANTLVNSAIEECTISNLGVVVMDELHMVDDDHRGYLMEIMATKILSLEQNIQIIGMSATVSNVESLAKWLKAKYYISNYRPVPIEENIVHENIVHALRPSGQFPETAPELNLQTSIAGLRNSIISRKIQPSQDQALRNSVLNSVVALANETARAGYGALIFCSSRAGCESDALLISRAMPEPCELTEELLERRKDLLNELRSMPTGVDLILERMIPRGVAFHHAGLTTEERERVAEAYDRGTLKVIVATCSLAAGINLPARRVILHGARMGRDLIGPSMLRQMRGRAGRKGKDEIGETYLCCQSSDLEAVIELLDAELPSVASRLAPEKCGVKRALLEVIAIKLATSKLAIGDYFQNTLLYHTMDYERLTRLIECTLNELVSEELIVAGSTSTFAATKLGKAIVASSLAPEDGIFIHKELKRAVQAFVMDGEMHFLYMFTPVQPSQLDINWQIFRKEMDSLDESALRVLGFVGIKPAFVNRMALGGCFSKTTEEDFEAARIHQRFYAAFQLRDLCNEMPIVTVARKYEIPRGSVQNLAQTCHGFAAGIVKFCERLEWGALATALDHMCDRLKAGAKPDLLELAQVTFIKSRTARVFWDNGYKSVGAVAAAKMEDLIPILLLAQNKKLRLHPDDDQKYHQKLFLKAETIIQSATRIWERLMQREMSDD